MKLSAQTICGLLLLATVLLSMQAVAFEFTKDNPDTLVGTNSSEHSIAGLKTGMTHDQAWQQIKKHGSLMGLVDKDNPSRIYVYSEFPDGSRGDSVLYLIWEKGMKNMKQIAVFQDFRSNLSPSFRRLLTFEAIDNNSEFKRKFIGYANRSKITLDLPIIEVKHTTYFYDDIGLEITHQHHGSDGEKVVFSLTQSVP